MDGILDKIDDSGRTKITLWKKVSSVPTHTFKHKVKAGIGLPEQLVCGLCSSGSDKARQLMSLWFTNVITQYYYHRNLYNHTQYQQAAVL